MIVVKVRHKNIKGPLFYDNVPEVKKAMERGYKIDHAYEVEGYYDIRIILTK